MRSFTSASPAGEYLYRFTAVETANTSITTCRITSSVLTVRINEKPTTSTTTNSPVCEGSTMSITAIGGDKYTWRGPGNYSATGGTISRVAATPAYAGKYFVTVESTVGCRAGDSADVVIAPRPQAATGFASAAVCKGSSISLNASGGETYVWSPPAGLSATNISDPVATPADSTTYTVVVFNQYQCTDSASVNIDVIASPQADAGPDQAILEGQSVQLLATIEGKIAGNFWSPAINISDAQAVQPTVFPPISTTYTLTAIADNGCGSASDTVRVTVYKKVIVPNAFSPNADGVNDTWHIIALNTYTDYNLTVFDRFGSRILQSKNYNNDWNGTFKGKPLPIGTYYYVIDLKRGLSPLRGWVTILR